MAVSYLARKNCRSWVKRQFAAPTIRGILGVELPSPDMTVPVTDRSLTGRDLTDRSGSKPPVSRDRLNDGFVLSPAIQTALDLKQSDAPITAPGNVSNGSTPDHCTAQTKVSYRVLRL